MHRCKHFQKTKLGFQLLTNTKDASTRRTTRLIAPVTTRVLKRKVGYGDEEEHNTRDEDRMDVEGTSATGQ